MSDDTDYLLRRLRVARATVPQDGPTDRVLAQAHDEIERLREALRAVLPVFDGDCYFDHDGDCQAHHADKLDGRCSVVVAREALAASLSETGGEGT